jgi:uncharacterized lipoprotein YddW (UPF0748 family)
VDVYHRGQVFFRSKTMSALIGPDGYAGYDLLAWALKAGDAFQIQVIAWFEYGLMAEPNSVFGQWASAHGWTLGALHNVSWLDPRQPQVLGFLAGILADAWIGYSTLGLAAVQLDDHFASPAALPLSPNVTMVTVHDMNEAMRTVSLALQSLTCPFRCAKLTLSPAPLDFALTQYHVNWTVWLQQGWVSAVVPQLYRTTLGSFQAALNATMDVLLTTGVCSLMHAVGIRVDGSGPATNWSDVVGMWRTVRTQTADATGVSVWFAHGIAELYPTQFRCLWMDSGCS